MRASATLALLLTTTLALTGCGGGNKVQIDKTIAHDGGILNVGQAVNVAAKLEARTGAGDWTDLSTADNKALEQWMEGKDSAEARTYIAFDDAQLPLETATVDSASKLKKMKSDLDNRMSAVNKFMKNNNKQLNARGW